MSTSKKVLFSKLGITESSLKGGNLFSPNNKSKLFTNDAKLVKGEKAIKYLSTANLAKKGSSGVSAYQNYRIDILVPYPEPPKSLITPDNKRFYNKSSTINTCNSPFKSPKEFNTISTKRSSANSSYLNNLANSVKLNSEEVYSPFNNQKTKRNSDLTGIQNK
jgi:hypothetical protein